jgi:hypothetical protein
MELLEEEAADNLAALPPCISGQPANLVHVGIEACQLLFKMPFGSQAVGNDPICPQRFQQPGERGSDLMSKPPYRVGAGTTGQMFGNEPSHGRLVYRTQGIPLQRQPMGEVRDTAKIDTPGTRRIPPPTQMLAIPSDIRLKDAVLQPGTRLRLEDDRFGHDDLLSGRKAQKEIRIMCRSIALRGASRRPSRRTAHNPQLHIISAM